MDKFDFEALPKPITRVLRDTLNWRNARDAAQDTIADRHLGDLEESTIAFKRWCMKQGEMWIEEKHRSLQAIDIRPKHESNRMARIQRIARGNLRLLTEDD